MFILFLQQKISFSQKSFTLSDTGLFVNPFLYCTDNGVTFKLVILLLNLPAFSKGNTNVRT